MATTTLNKCVSALGQAAGAPADLLAAAAFVAVWGCFEPETLDWHAAATIVTLVLAILIERNQSRDSRALQGKLDKLIRGTEGARDERVELDGPEARKGAGKADHDAPVVIHDGRREMRPYFLDI